MEKQLIELEGHIILSLEDYAELVSSVIRNEELLDKVDMLQDRVDELEAEIELTKIDQIIEENTYELNRHLEQKEERKQHEYHYDNIYKEVVKKFGTPDTTLRELRVLTDCVIDRFIQTHKEFKEEQEMTIDG